MHTFKPRHNLVASFLKTLTPLTFRLVTQKPFMLVELDPSSNKEGNTKAQSTDMHTLKPRHSLVSFLKTLTLVWYPASLCVRKVDVWHNRKMAAYPDRKQNGCSLYKAYGALTKSVIAIDRGPAKCRHSADVSPNSYRFRKYPSGYLP